MAKSSGVRCGCGEVQFTVIEDFKVSGSDKITPVIICDSCGRGYHKPKNFRDTNGIGY